MKKRLLCVLLLTALMLLALSGCGETVVENDYVKWELSEDMQSLSDGVTTFQRYDELPLGMRLENGHVRYFNEVEAYDELYYVRASRFDSGIRYLYHGSLGLTAYVAGENDKADLDSFLSGGASKIRIVDYSYHSSYAVEIDMSFVNELDSLSENAIELEVRRLKSAVCHDVVFFAADDTLARTYGAIYEYNEAMYYVNYDELGNNYFDSYGDFSFGRGKVTMYPLEGDIANAFAEKLGNMVEYGDEYTYTSESELYEEPEEEITREEALSTVLSITLILGVIIPLAPLTFGIIIAIKKKAEEKICAYVLIGASAMWILSGILILILSL
ncbi:MAG: hypothetical protein IJW53_04605 [Clostridia bacterium]|nr:hypothetical protein [Clostridia bacterium]